MRLARWLSVSALVLFATASQARATIAIALDLDELAVRADAIVIGTVVGQESHWDGRRIVTDVSVVVDEHIAGRAAPGDTVLVRRMGGNVGDIGMRIEGEAAFVDGDRMLLFLRRSAAGDWLYVVGMAQGAMRLTDDATPLVEPAAEGLALVRRLPDGRLAGAPSALMTPRPLPEVVAQIRRALAVRAVPSPAPSPTSPTR